jgi:hypothetical protein
MVSGEKARGGSMGVGEDTSLVWGHAMSCGWSAKMAILAKKYGNLEYLWVKLHFLGYRPEWDKIVLAA